MYKYQVGDKMKITRKSDNDTGERGVMSQTDLVGIIQECWNDKYCIYVDGKYREGDDNYLGIFEEEELELLPQTQDLTLEDVYTVTPQKVLNRAVRTQVKELGIPFSEHINDEHTHFHLYKGVFHAANHDNWDKKEVSIPQFLYLLTQYSQRKKEVKVQLNDLLEAVVDMEKEVVNVYYGHPSKDREPNPLTFQQLLDFQQALKGGGHGFERGDTLYLTDPDLTHLFTKYAKKKGVKVAKDTDQEQNPSLVYVGGELGTCVGQGYNSLEKMVLTIDQFLAKCQSSPLPKLVGYEVTKTEEGNIKVGCQTVELERFEALMEAITTK